MKRTLLLSLLLIFMMCFSGALFAQVTVELGTGTDVSTTSSAPAPYGTFYKAFRQQFLVLASELNNEGAGAGNINSLAFNVSALNNITPMNNFRIRLKHTDQTTLSTTFETGTYTQVYQFNDFMPTVGWNTHVFTTPFVWDGASNLLIETVTDVITGAYAQNASTFYTPTTFNSSLRFQSDSANGDTGTTGTAALNRSNMKLSMSALDLLDIAAVSIVGPTTPSVNSASSYTVRVRNLSPDPVSNYSVKLLSDTVELFSLPGVTLGSMEYEEFEFEWTPTATGLYTLYGKVVMPGDENPLNDLTQGLDVTVMEEGLLVVQVGEGTLLNTETGVPTPYGTYFKNFRQQYLVTADELFTGGATPGSITAMAFNVSSVGNCGPMPNYRIRLKHTNQTALTTTFETGDYQQVFHAPEFLPTADWNMHAFQVPFYWDGASNLIVEIVTDLAPAVGRNALVYYAAMGFNSSVRYQSDSIAADGYATGTVSVNRSNMRFYISTEDTDDMAALGISGPVFANVGSVSNFTVRVMNICPDPVSNYTVKLMEVDGGVLATVPGVLIDHLEMAEITIPWTPTQVGTTQVYGRVEMPGDENSLNNDTYPFTVNVIEAGDSAFVVGDGTASNAYTAAPAPYGTYYQSFRQQLLVKADEIYASGGAPGMLSGIAFDVSALNGCAAMTNYRIKLKSTDQIELSTTFELGDYTQVFQTASFMPTLGWNIHEFDAPFFWDGVSNLIVEIITDLCGVTGQNASAKYSTPGFYSSLRAQSNTANSETTATGTRSLNRSNICFFLSESDIVDMAAVSITGPYTPNVNSTVSYTVRVMSSTSDTVTNYTVKLMDGNDNVLASVAGPAIDYLESEDIVLSWTPTVTGEYQLYGRVEMPGDEYESNNNTSPITVHVMEAGLFVAQIGDGVAVNTDTGVPNAYGTYWKNFRQHFLVKADELYAVGAAPGFINAIAFEVANLNAITASPGYRIRIKETNLETLSTTFELGNYTQVFQATNFMPVNGWNLHPFSEPFFWDGASNIIVEIVTDLAAAVGRYASSPYTATSFNSSLRYQSDSVVAEGYATGTVAANRTNMRLFMDLGEIGSLRGTVTSIGFPMGDVNISIEDTVWSQTTLANGTYNFPVVLAGDYQVTAHKVGFEDVTLPVTISAGEESILNFDMEASTNVMVSGKITGSDNPTVGLENTTVLFSGPLNYQATTNSQGNFNLTVLSGNTYNYTILKDGYQATSGSIDVGSVNYNMGTIIIEELTLPPGPVLAELNDTETAVNLIWSPPGGTGGHAMYFDFENDDGDWIPTASWDAVGDWEYTDEYDIANWNPVYTGTNVIPPPNAYSGTGMWGTKINTNYTNSGGFNYLSKTFDFSGLTDATLRFRSWENVFGDFDYCQVSINGTLVWGPSYDYTGTQWRERVVDLSAYDGVSEVTVRFEMYATTTVNYAGWYIDDVEIANAASFRAPVVSLPTVDIRFAGLSEIEAARLVESDGIRSPRQTHTQTAALSTAPRDQRIPVGYRAWRLTTGQENNENLWTELTTTAITDTTLTDPSWVTLPDAVYKWAVKTVYTNNVLSDPRFSNAIRLQPNDLSALEIYGNTTPTVNSEITHTVKIKNTGTSAQAAGAYTVKIMHGNNELASATGPAIAVSETLEIPLTWTPTETGPMIISGLVILPGDSEPTNDMTPPLEITVMGEGLFVIQLGDGTITNTETGAPAPYGTYFKSFRQQFLYRTDEIYALGAAPGLITALAFDVQSIGTCSPMPNYRIRLKHTNQTALTTTFETGTYQQVFQAASFMPVNGWNVHAFSTPFIWNGTDNILVDIITDVFQDAYTRNALTYYITKSYNSSLRFQSDSAAGDTGTTGTTSMNRSNTRFFMVIDDMGSLSGTVTENGHPVPNMLITIEDTVFSTTTNQNGAYNFSFAPAGTQTVSASKNGYTTVSHTVVIVEDEETVQNFSVVGSPEFALSEDSWNFGDVTIGGSSNKTFQIINAGGGELTIQSITHAGSGAFVLTQPTLPVTLRTDQTLNLPITFTPAILGDVTATFTITDDQNNRYLITGRTSSVTGRASSAPQDSRDVHEFIVSGSGVHSIHIGDGSQNARMPLDFYYKNSMFQTIFTATELNDFTGMVTGIKLYNNFSSNLLNKPIKIWMGSTTQTDLSAGWISSNNMTLVFDGMVNFPSGENVIAINFPEMYMHLDGGNLVLLVHRPLDTDYYSSLDSFKCQTLGSTRSRNVYSDTVVYDPTNMSAGTLTGQYPKMTLEVIPGGVGHIEGIVRGAGGAPLPGVSINLDQRVTATSDANGMFYINNLLPNDYELTLSRYGYLTQTVDVTVEEDVTEELDITMEEMPKVSVTGTVVASDTGDGIGGATLTLSGYADYTVATNLAGDFIVDASVYAYNTYDYVLTATGYTTLTGSIEVGPQDYNMGVLTMNELAFAPTQVVATLNDDVNTVSIGWNPPDPDAFEIVESFEGVIFPPETWTQTITNNGVPNMNGVRPTWCRFSVAEGVTPSEGAYQAGLAWVAEHQDEWLFTPGFTCPPDAYVKFDTHLNMGSEGGDHYYVKVSLDNGASWQVLWDGANQPAGVNNYATPIVIDLTQYAGLTIKLAWHADDGVDAFGMWYNWYIDNIYIGNFQRTEQLSTLTNLGSAISAKDTSEAVK
ncbi:MAG: carboxypeptidase regulatory-like domain-containing protein, partial [Candidatus Cloacimonetes bacterium]|nr:carboxypeptidase regulatory-like domain-containing protein [Candidatus Cloacimonadota bacterium]